MGLKVDDLMVKVRNASLDGKGEASCEWFNQTLEEAPVSGETIAVVGAFHAFGGESECNRAPR